MANTGETGSDRVVRILHLSDFHFKEDKEWDHKPIREGLLKTVREFVDDGRVPDVVAITGDIASEGKVEDYALAQTWIDESLLKCLPADFPKSRVLIVPGNHDVNRKEVKAPAQGLQKSLLEEESEEKMQENIAEALQDSDSRGLLLKRHTAYLDFAKGYGPLDKDPALPWWRAFMDFNGSKVLVAGLCSSWMSWSKEDQGRLLIGKYQVNTVFDGAPTDASLCVVLLHHPWDFIAELDSLRVRDEIRRRANLVVRGHLHLQRSEVYRDPDNACVELTAGSVYKGSKWPNAFQLIELVLDRRVVRIHYRLWHKDEWVPDRINYKNAPDGIAEFPLDPAPTEPGAGAPARPPGDPRKYLEALRNETAYIDIRGLEVGSGKATRMPIDRLYIPLVTTAREQAEGKKGPEDSIAAMERGGPKTVDLRQTLKHRCVVVVGDPGSGKSTFLKRCAFELVRRLLGEPTENEGVPWDAIGEGFPILIRLPEFGQHIAESKKRKEGPVEDDAPRWLAHFVAARCDGRGDGLNEDYLLWRIRDAGAIVLLDGLDEVVSKPERIRLTKLIEAAAEAFTRSRFVVTTRPAAYSGEVILHGFEAARIESLEEEAIINFLECWCHALWQSSEEEAKRHLADLLRPLRERPEIRRMARNPVMLTALAVVHWQDKQLPEQRADLYESIVRWLAKSRQEKPGRPSVDRCIGLLQELALAMHDHPKGRQVLVTRHWGAGKIASTFRDKPKAERLGAAKDFLKQEEQDSGIIVGRGEDHLAFWHLTFQEYLAARALGGRSEAEQSKRLLGTNKLYQPEWREVVQLLAGVLHHQGVERLDAMLQAILSRVGARASLKDKARCAGLLSGVLYDLAPVKYKPEDERHQQILDDALAVFDAKRSKGVPINDAIEAAEAIGQADDPRFRDLDSDNLWVTIPAGEFWMGAQKTKPSGRNYDTNALDSEAPVHKVVLGAYKVGRYPVTVAEYERFVEDGGYGKDQFWSAGGFGTTKEPARWADQLPYRTRPVVGVSWFEAAAYAAWADHRLPTEAEWERAARGPDARQYPWGNDKPNPNLLNFDRNVGRPTPVGIYPLGASAEGALDMAGNVWEWCNDWYGPYCKDVVVDPKGPSSGGARVLRGGSWFNLAELCRSTFRHRNRPVYGLDNFGFRLAAGT